MGVIEASGFARKGVPMTGKQSAAEWLRGIADEYEAEEDPGCGEMARLFGFCCADVDTCPECRVKMMRAIADRIGAERELPEGIEWPRFEDGELVKVGDEVECEGDVMDVVGLFFEDGKWRIHGESSLAFGFLHGKYGELVKRPTPKVLDADGAPIEVGDTVYEANKEGHCVSFSPYLVVGIDERGKCVCVKDGKGAVTHTAADLFTHERPDSWERIEEDTKLAPRDYLESRGMNPEKPERIASMMADLVRRAKALAKGEQR